MLSANDIRSAAFEKAKFNGYKPEEVERFLNEVASDYERLKQENGELVTKLEILADKLEEYRNEEDSIRSALLSAQRLGDSTLREAKHKASIISDDAKIKADRLVNDAEANAEKTISDAQAKADKLISEAQFKADNLVKDAEDQSIKETQNLKTIKLQVTEFKENLLEMYKKHLQLIGALPQEEPEKEEPKPETSKEAKQEEKTASEQKTADDNSSDQPKAEEMPVKPAEPEQVKEEPAKQEKTVTFAPAASPVTTVKTEDIANDALANNASANDADEMGVEAEFVRFDNEQVNKSDSANEVNSANDSTTKDNDSSIHGFKLDIKDIDDEDVHESKFGKLKFGEDYDIDADDDDYPEDYSFFKKRKKK